jgi:hypothetical protein
MRFVATSLDGLKLELERELALARRPLGPTPLYACPTDAMPPAQSHPACVLLNTSLNALAVSDGSRWIRQDTGEPI